MPDIDDSKRPTPKELHQKFKSRGADKSPYDTRESDPHLGLAEESESAESAVSGGALPIGEGKLAQST
jgi:hypothetical protein